MNMKVQLSCFIVKGTGVKNCKEFVNLFASFSMTQCLTAHMTRSGESYRQNRLKFCNKNVERR